MLATLVGLVLFAQSPAALLQGRVLDASGAPIEGACVGAGSEASFHPAPYELLAVDTTDADGAFAIELPSSWLERIDSRGVALFAHAPGHGLAYQRTMLEHTPVGMDLELHLPPHPETKVRIVDAEGRPVLGARALPISIEHPELGPSTMPTAWLETILEPTDADGWVRLPVPLEDVERLRVLAHDHAPHEFVDDYRTPEHLTQELALLPNSEVRVTWEGEEPPRGRLTIAHYTHLGPGVTHRIESELEARLDGSTPVTLRAPTGRKHASLTSDDASALVWSFDGKALAAGDVRLVRAEQPYTVRGRIVDAVSNAPVPATKFLASGATHGWVTTDAEGRFEFATATPTGALQAVAGPEGYCDLSYLEGSRFDRPADGATVELGDLPIPRSNRIEGIVRDENGSTVAGAWIHARGTFPVHASNRPELATLSDANGRFVLHHVPQGMHFAVTARSANGARASASATSSARVELVLAQRLAARGRVVDSTGAPVENAIVEVWRASPPRLTGGEKRELLGGREHVATDEDGRFETAAGLEPGVHYALRVTGSELEPIIDAYLDAAEHDRGRELVVKRRGVLRGTLRDADGAPIAGALVRLRRGRSSTRTDADGAFELPAFPRAGDVLIATEFGGDGPRARWVEASEVLDWQLGGHEGARVASPAPPHDRARELEIAFELLDAQYRTALASGDEPRLLRAVQQLAWADPALTLERVESGIFETGWRARFSRAEVANALRASSPEEALAVARRIGGGMSAALSTLKSAELLEPEAEHEQLALVRAEARAVEPPEHRLVVLANLADRLLELGEDKAARELLDEGRALAESLPRVEWPGFARCRFAEVLAYVDYDAARKLIDELEDVADRDRHLGNLAQRMAARDPARAEALLAEVQANHDSWDSQRYAGRVAYAMAPVDLERARAIAQRHDRSGYADGMIALALTDTALGIDPARNTSEALVSLETAFRCAEDAARPATWSHSRTAVTASLLVVAERVDPMNLDRWIARALAIPRPRRNADSHEEAISVRADATLAFFIARWDRELASALLAHAVEAATQLDPETLGWDGEILWAALAVTDPDHAAKIAREVGGRAATTIGRVLAHPPADRTRYVQENLLNLWVVGKEDL